MIYLLAIYELFSMLALCQALVMCLQTWEHRRFARSRLNRQSTASLSGPVLVIVPCKGLEPGLEQHLDRLFRQDHAFFSIRLVVQSADDAALPVIERVRALRARVPSEVIIAGDCERSGQKVHNLLAATADLPSDIEVLAFADSDACPTTDWLSRLTDRLDAASGPAAVTGYRWFVPTNSSWSASLAACLNGTVAALFGPGGHYLVWGGSWAIRRTAFESIHLRDAWQGTLSDDLVASRELHRAALSVEFEPCCMVRSPWGGGLPQLIEFGRRQYLIARMYVPRWWLAGCLASLLAVVGFWTGPVLTVAGLIAGSSWWPAPLLMTAIVYLATAMRGFARQKLAGIYLAERSRADSSRRDDAVEPEPTASDVDRGCAPSLQTSRLDIWGAPLMQLFQLGLILSSCVGRTLTWRGIHYELDATGQVIRATNLANGPHANRADAGALARPNRNYTR